MTDLIHARHKVSKRIQEITPDQFAVFSDVLEEITPEEAEQARIDALLNPPVEGEEAGVVDLDTPPATYPEGEPNSTWKVGEIDDWAREQEPVVEFPEGANKDAKLDQIKGND